MIAQSIILIVSYTFWIFQVVLEKLTFPETECLSEAILIPHKKTTPFEGGF